MNYGDLAFDDVLTATTTPAQRQAASANVARRALDSEDQARLLAMLGLEAAT